MLDAAIRTANLFVAALAGRRHAGRVARRWPPGSMRRDFIASTSAA